MPLEVVDCYEWKSETPCKRRCVAYANEEGADEAGPRRNADEIEWAASFFQGCADERIEDTQMFPRSDLRNNPAVARVGLRLRREQRAGNTTIAIENCYGCFVAGCLDGDGAHGSVVSSQRSANRCANRNCQRWEFFVVGCQNQFGIMGAFFGVLVNFDGDLVSLAF